MRFTNWRLVKQQLAAESKTGRVMCFRRWSCDPKVLACKSIRTTHKRRSRLYLGAGSRSVCASVGSLKSGSKPFRHLSQRLSYKRTKPEALKQPLPAWWRRELLNMTRSDHIKHKFFRWNTDTTPSDHFKQPTLTQISCMVLKSSRRPGIKLLEATVIWVPPAGDRALRHTTWLQPVIEPNTRKSLTAAAV